MVGYTVTWVGGSVKRKDYIRANSCKKALELFTLCYGLQEVIKIELT